MPVDNLTGKSKAMEIERINLKEKIETLEDLKKEFLKTVPDIEKIQKTQKEYQEYRKEQTESYYPYINTESSAT